MCCISTDSTTSEQRLSSAGKHGGIQSTVVIVPPRHTTLSPSPVASTPNPSVAPGSKHERSSTVARLANDLVLIATHYPELSENMSDHLNRQPLPRYPPPSHVKKAIMGALFRVALVLTMAGFCLLCGLLMGMGVSTTSGFWSSLLISTAKNYGTTDENLLTLYVQEGEGDGPARGYGLVGNFIVKIGLTNPTHSNGSVSGFVEMSVYKSNPPSVGVCFSATELTDPLSTTSKQFDNFVERNTSASFNYILYSKSTKISMKASDTLIMGPPPLQVWLKADDVANGGGLANSGLHGKSKVAQGYGSPLSTSTNGDFSSSLLVNVAQYWDAPMSPENTSGLKALRDQCENQGFVYMDLSLISQVYMTLFFSNSMNSVLTVPFGVSCEVVMQSSDLPWPVPSAEPPVAISDAQKVQAFSYVERFYSLD
eukprot:GHVQ01009592.1.p1 GENE.GHVQ01009592.1~~GHVQ01009592.1.p1  ORF type:complete len:425 (-),score=56.20 GHVQ01009592.1:602-1876(-)